MILTAEEARKQAHSCVMTNEILQDILKRIDIESRQGRLTCKYDPGDNRLNEAEWSYLESLGYEIDIRIPGSSACAYDKNYYISWGAFSGVVA